MLAVPNVSGATGVAMTTLEGVLSPIALVATTVTLYSIRLVRLVMVQEVAVVSVTVTVQVLVSTPAAVAVAVYVVMSLPPLSVAGTAVQLTVIVVFPATADTPVGASGTLASTLTIKVSAAVAGVGSELSVTV